jgi:hypothetical protein
MQGQQKHNWIGNPILETTGILLIPFFCIMIVFLLPESLLENDTIHEATWLFLIVFVDVAHVYSTLYRTYIDKELVSKNKGLFFGLPMILLAASVVLHSIDSLIFWRCLAYMAVFHFIRQQYGFMRIYSRKETVSRFKTITDSVTIYGSTFLPVLYWHFSERNFSWFVKGDFFKWDASSVISLVILILFWSILGIYLITEIISIVKNKSLNFQKNMIVAGTALSWYIGIVHFNSDLIFTLLNVICHGVPYMILVWIHGKKSGASKNNFVKLLYGRFSLLFFLIPLLFFAYFEEGLWDVLVWKDHSSLFPFGSSDIHLSKSFLNIIVPVLALPQLFHYVIDGFIWKMREDKFEWAKILH